MSNRELRWYVRICVGALIAQAVGAGIVLAYDAWPVACWMFGNLIYGTYILRRLWRQQAANRRAKDFGVRS